LNLWRKRRELLLAYIFLILQARSLNRVKYWQLAMTRLPIPVPAKVGDTVIYKKWGGNEVKIKGVEYLFAKFDDILAVVTA